MRKGRMPALFVLAAVLAACGDNAVAPRGAPPAATASRRGGGSNAQLTNVDTVRFSITIDPASETTYDLGSGNSLLFPAHSLCDPKRSSYGESEWDKPCTLATAPVTISVRAWIGRNGHPQVDFTPSVRFAPSSDPARWVVLSFADYQASVDPMYKILYCQKPQSACKDESKKDPSLATTRDPITGQITRRVKHFSGYNVAAGDAGDSDYSLGSSAASVHGVAVRLDASSVFPKRSDVRTLLQRAAYVRRHSGYVLASG